MAFNAVMVGRFLLASAGGLLLGVLMFADVVIFGGPELFARVLALAVTVGLGVVALRADSAARALQRLTGAGLLGFVAPLSTIYREITRARAPHGGALPAGDVGEGVVGIVYFLGAAITGLLFLIFTVVASRTAPAAPAAPAPAPAAAPVEED